MAVSTSKSVSMTGNGLSSWVPLAKGWNRVYIKSTAWSTSSVAVVLNNVDSSAYAAAEDANGAVVATSNKSFDLLGPGLIAGVMSTYGSTAVTLTVTDLLTDTPKK